MKHCSQTQKTPPAHQEVFRAGPHTGLIRAVLTFALIRHPIYCIVYQQGVGLQVEKLLER